MKKKLKKMSKEDVADKEPSEAIEETKVPQRRSSSRLQNCPKKPRVADTFSSSEEDPFATDSDSSYNYESFSRRKSQTRRKFFSNNKITKRNISGRKQNISESEQNSSESEQNSSESEQNSSESEQNSTESEQNNIESEQNNVKKKREPTKINKEPSFVVLKADVQKGVYPDLWKIDGKSLLQKYVPFEEDSEILYKNTSVYSGWTLNSRDQYLDAEVEFVRRSGRDTVVRFRIDDVSDESD